MKPVFLLLSFFLIGVLIIVYYKTYTVARMTQALTTPMSQSIPFSLAVPPPESLKGSIVSFSDDIQWQSREATVPAQLAIKVPVFQGEDFWTGEKGKLVIEFLNTLTIQVFPTTHIALIQTLPDNFVMLQDSGKANYINTSIHTPISIRVSPLIVQEEKGEIEIEKDDELTRTTITVKKGAVTIGFNDSDNISNVVRVSEGSVYTFDNEARTGEVSIRDE